MCTPPPVLSPTLRTDLAVTTAHGPSPEMRENARRLAAELHAPILSRRGEGFPFLFESNPGVERLLVVQTGRLLLVQRTGEELFYHPNTGYLRLGTVLRGGRDLLLEAAALQAGEAVLDCTLGYAAEAILCAHVVGDTGIVHGIEAVPELGIVVREGLRTVSTKQEILNAAMRRVQVVHLGHHLDFLRACPDHHYDVVCFDPFFEEVLPRSETFVSIRIFGQHSPLLPEAVHEARRVARRRVLVKAVRWADTLSEWGITEAVTSKSSKVVYGILPAY